MKQIKAHINSYITPEPEADTESSTTTGDTTVAATTTGFLQESSQQISILKYFVNIMNEYDQPDLAKPLVQLQSFLQTGSSDQPGVT